MKRSRQEIIDQILNVCTNSASKTKIVYQVNLNFKTVNPYLDILLKNHMIEAIEGKQVLYKTTREGLELQETIKRINDNLL